MDEEMEIEPCAHPPTTTVTEKTQPEEDVKEDLNLSMLDELVLDYLVTHGELHNQASKELLAKAREYNTKLTELQQIRSCIISGDILQARQRIAEIYPALINDPRILFRFHKQHFVELLRQRENTTSTDSVEKALEFCRKELGPFALDAYPEAYSDFKHALLLLLYDMNDSSSPVAKEWSDAHREDFANVIYSTLLTATGLHEPQFPLLLKYLLTTHNIYHIYQGIESRYTELSSLLFPERLPGPIPLEGASRPFSETIIQSLAQSVGITRQDAIECLKYTRGDTNAAFKSELGRMRLRTERIVELAHEYAAWRGLAGAATNSSLSLTETSGSMLESLSTVRQLLASGKIRAALTAASEVISTSVEECEAFLSSALPPPVVFRLRQGEFIEALCGGQSETALEIARLRLAPLAERHPELSSSFRETTILLAFAPADAERATSSVLAKADLAGVASAVITVLAQKSTPSASSATSHTAPTASSHTEPKLVGYMKYLLHCHTRYFRQLICTDPFDNVFGLERLKRSDTPAPASESAPSSAAAAAASSGASQREVLSVEPAATGVDEDAVVKLMEFMALSRAEAVSLLSQFGGNLDAVLQVLLS